MCKTCVHLRNLYWVSFFEHIYEIDYSYSNIKVLGKGKGWGGVQFDT